MTSSPDTSLLPRFRFFSLAAIFTGAFLFFLVQPLIGKTIIPWFGGTAATWSVILLFFQGVLLAGYLTAYGISRLAPRIQPWAYILLALLALLFNQIKPAVNPHLALSANPQFLLLFILLRHVGLPCLFLATVSTTIQNWWGNYARTNPYTLYSLSNIGSFLALLSFPIALEPLLTLNQIFLIWRAGFFLLIALCCLAAFSILRGHFQPSPFESHSDDSPSASIPSSPFLWFWLPLLTCALLLSFTEHLCHDIAPIPLLWVLPLAVYLFSYILVFNENFHFNENLLALWALFSSTIFIFLPRIKPWLGGAITITLICLFSLCLWAHFWLARLKPGSTRLPTFYFFTALGGAAGGTLVSLIAPILFVDYYEMWLSFGLLILSVSLVHISVKSREGSLTFIGKLFALPVGILVAFSFFLAVMNQDFCLYKIRNFYGVLKVLNDGPVIELKHGSTFHGSQYRDPDMASIPTTYYSSESGVGLMMAQLQKESKHPLKVGLIGLGTGTMASYGRAGDEFTFYEINPAVVHIAHNRFTYLKNTRAKINIVMGDARLSLLDSPPQNFDLLLVDAFSSDSVPVHLLTQEAMQLYLRNLAPNGVIALHLSNRFLKLNLLAGALARQNHLHGYIVDSRETSNHFFLGSSYALISRQSFQLNAPDNIHVFPIERVRPIEPWTDDYSNLFSILRTKR